MTTEMIWLHVPAADESVDSEWELRTADYQSTNIGIQDCRSYGGGYAVNEYGPDKDHIEWSRDCGMRKTLEQAKALALQVYAKREVR